MRSTLNLAVVFLSVAAVFLTGCSKGDPLDYETAMNVMRERTVDPVRTSFSAVMHSDNQDPKIADAYQELIRGHVIQCKPNAAMGTFCEPGPAGEAVTQSGVSDLSLVAGRWVPSSIVAIRRVGRDSATADVRMTFEPSPLFREFESVLNRLQSADITLALSTREQGKLVHATFQRYEDGWHVESVE